METINNNDELTTAELENLKEILSMFERQTKKITAVEKFSGGFATAEMFDYDLEYVDIELQWGVQSDVENTVHTENYKLDRTIILQDIPCYKKVNMIKDA